MFSIMAIKIIPRSKIAPTVQEILTKYGCIITTRIGLHEASNDECSQAGLIILNLINDKTEEISNLASELNELDGVSAKILNI